MILPNLTAAMGAYDFFITSGVETKYSIRMKSDVKADRVNFLI